ncbi:hypothetical protein JCGZ_13676 [Jatropha curcas]|uniref:GATA transcription factor n=1 Tax=Jatropha curcas TaxID=180498 RepID=A0A067KCD8_JATCU|nr:GATA transcription factor 5 [Jatropha curcas]KDP32678.1 hypothetical protein JCGZ_13676 [Jatropha curcas]
MLYQTYSPFIFHFLSTTTSSISSSFSSPLQLQKTQMECVEVALKTSISRQEMAFKFNQQDSCDDTWTVNVQNGSTFDDSIVDELLDFSNEPGFIGGDDEEEEEENVCTACVSPKQKALEADKLSNDKSSDYDFGSVPASELGVPVDDLSSLEWLSHFVEDSNSEYSAPFPAVIVAAKPKQENYRFEPQNPVLITEPCFNTPVPAKARSKRTRTSVKVRNLWSSSLTESSSSSSSTTSSSSSNPSSPCLVFPSPGMSHELTEKSVFYVKPPAKKLKKRPAGEYAGGGSQPPRRCSHCGVQKTPQWRTGPLGAKTLCNACGVRFKSGRLFPEYRPACSPTFSSELHSNHHRKVLEMRKKKEQSDQPETDLAPSVVPSF